MNKFRKIKSFTILELLFVAVISAMIFTVVIMLYIKIAGIKSEMEGKQTLIQSSYNMLERINILMQNYTIDYEEYYNRNVSKCNGGTWDVDKDGGGGGGHCGNFTTYGNDSAHPFGQYADKFWSANADVDGDGNVQGDDDDVDNGSGVVAVPDNNNVQELYLISKDKKERLFIRRKFKKIANYPGVTNTNKVDRLYSLQILRLRGFDAGSNHDFNSPGMYDGKIDTWACDYSKGFICGGDSVGGAYGNYRLPTGADNERVDFFPETLTVTSWNIEVNPVKDPKLAWNDMDVQINPYIKINFKTKLFAESWFSRVPIERLDRYELDLQTIFNIKTNY